MSRKYGYAKKKRPPKGWEVMEPVLNALEAEMRDVTADPHEGKRRVESTWGVVQLNNQRSRYVYDMFYRYKRIKKPVYDWCLKQHIADAALIAKWKKPGYERLCCTFNIDPRNFNFGTGAQCRVPRFNRNEEAVSKDRHSGCIGCASGKGGFRNIFGNKYGQNLADIQAARERAERLSGEDWRTAGPGQAAAAAAAGDRKAWRKDWEGAGPVIEPNGEVWATEEEEQSMLDWEEELEMALEDARDARRAAPAARDARRAAPAAGDALPAAAAAAGAGQPAAVAEPQQEAKEEEEEADEEEAQDDGVVAAPQGKRRRAE